MDSETEELIRRRAYAIWEREGRPHGQHDEHWKRAHAEMHGLEDAPAAGRNKPSHVAPAGGKAEASGRDR